jgi:hypothetical protein
VANVTKADEWLQPEKLLLLEDWARQGLFDAQIAKNMGISEATLYRYKANCPEIKEALRKGKEVVDIEVENAMLKRALGYTITINEQKVDKDGYVHDLKRDVHIPGDVTAQIFWLKNRRRQQWRDKVEVEKGESVQKIEIINDLPKDEENGES